MRLDVLTVCTLVANAVATPSLNHVLHEKRNKLPFGWGQRKELDGKAILPMKIGLAQENLDKAEDYLMEVSHPDSPKFGQHWSAQQIAETFAPRQESVKAVIDWLVSSGITLERVSRSQSLGWLHFDATVEEAERLLKTEYHVYTHRTGRPHVACSEYHVPKYISRHIDFITPTVHFDTKLPMGMENHETRFKRAATTTAAAGHPVQTKAALGVGAPGSGSLPKKGANIDIKGFVDELKNCDLFITPNCLRALYEFPPGVSANPKNSYGIVEYTPQSFLQGDLDLFFANFSRRQVQRTPIIDDIDGGAPQTTNQSFRFNGESDLDLEYAMTLVNPQKVTLYQTGDFDEGASFNNFLDAIDGSYCTFEGGDDPTQDATYPDPFPGGYTGPENCGGFAATKVISTSYAYNEADLTAAYEMRQCAEYMKLGLAGTTILYSSGDNGVAGNLDECINANGTYNNGTSGMFNPSFPSTCPYVTSVGATQIKPGATVTQPEEACETVIFSGGGFSNVFALPSYQTNAVKSFFANHPPPYTAAQYNNSQVSRGFPDISANGANYVVAIDGNFSLVYGTSASSPTVGSIITLINEARFAAGKGSVGFINPTLYANPDALNDITIGGNQGCGTPGFSSVPGWDPVTGLGTPNFPKLLAKFLAL